TGERLAAAGVMAVLIGDDGMLLAANKPFADRALGRSSGVDHGLSFADLVRTPDGGLLHLVPGGGIAAALRAAPVPRGPAQGGGAGTVLIFDQHDSNSLANSTNVQALLEILPIGLA